MQLLWSYWGQEIFSHNFWPWPVALGASIEMREILAAILVSWSKWSDWYMVFMTLGQVDTSGHWRWARARARAREKDESRTHLRLLSYQGQTGWIKYYLPSCAPHDSGAITKGVNPSFGAAGIAVIVLKDLFAFLLGEKRKEMKRDHFGNYRVTKYDKY